MSGNELGEKPDALAQICLEICDSGDEALNPEVNDNSNQQEAPIGKNNLLKLPTVGDASQYTPNSDFFLVDIDNMPLCQNDFKKLKNKQKAKQDLTPDQIKHFQEAKLKAAQKKQQKKAKKAN